MTYNVFGGTLNLLSQSQDIKECVYALCDKAQSQMRVELQTANSLYEVAGPIATVT